MINPGRLFNVPGEILIAVKGGLHMSGRAIGRLTELGLAKAEVRFAPNVPYQDVMAIGAGDAPADVRWRSATADVTFTLIHHSPDVLEMMVDETMANGGFRYGAGDLGERLGRAGTLAPTGRLLGGRKPMYASGNHFFSVNLIPGGQLDDENREDPYRFRRCHLLTRPVVVHLGTDVQEVEVRVRAIPDQNSYRSGAYSGSSPGLAMTVTTLSGTVTVVPRRESLTSGAVLWDRTVDTAG